jgi:hypothetical protein
MEETATPGDNVPIGKPYSMSGAIFCAVLHIAKGLLGAVEVQCSGPSRPKASGLKEVGQVLETANLYWPTRRTVLNKRCSANL